MMLKLLHAGTRTLLALGTAGAVLAVSPLLGPASALGTTPGAAHPAPAAALAQVGPAAVVLRAKPAATITATLVVATDGRVTVTIGTNAKRVTLKYRTATGKKRTTHSKTHAGAAVITLPAGATSIRVRALATSKLATSRWLTATPLRPGNTPSPSASPSPTESAGPVNYASPVPRADQYQAANNQLLDTAAAGLPTLLDNDTDPQGKPLLVEVATSDTASALGAQVTLSADGQLRYDPRTSAKLRDLTYGREQADSFQYAVSDGLTAAVRATVTIIVSGRNLPPVVQSEKFQTDEATALTVPAESGLLVNDSDPEGSPLLASGDTHSELGASVTINPDGSFTYDPRADLTLRLLNANDAREDHFSYKAADSLGATAQQTVTVWVTGIDDPRWQNPANHVDVNADGRLSPMDALVVVSWINTHPAGGTIPADTPAPPYIDVNGDDSVTAIDVLIVITALNDAAG